MSLWAGGRFKTITATSTTLWHFLNTPINQEQYEKPGKNRKCDWNLHSHSKRPIQGGFNSEASPVYRPQPYVLIWPVVLYLVHSHEKSSPPEREETQSVFIRALNRAQAGACAEPQLQWYYTAFMLWAVLWTAERADSLWLLTRLFSLKNHRRFTDISTVSTRPLLGVQRHHRRRKPCRTEGHYTV